MNDAPRNAAREVPIEVAWFAALCDDDYEFLGVADPKLRSSWEHCRNIVLDAQGRGYDNILLPSGYELGIDAVAFAGGIAPLLNEGMRMLVAVRMGELWPPQLARQLATLDQMSGGRLTINIISSDLPGATLASAPRYRRTLEAMQIVRGLLNGIAVDVDGEFYQIALNAPTVRPHNAACPPMYFGGLSEAARDVAAQAADVYLMWPETEQSAAELIADMRDRAALYGRTLRFGFRTHVVVRETEREARSAAQRLLSRLDDEQGERIRARSLDSASAGVNRQRDLREQSDNDGYVEPNLWTGIGRARSGCGAAIVGDASQVRDKLLRYRDLGIDSFILSGYPHRDECNRFADLVLSELNHCPL